MKLQLIVGLALLVSACAHTKTEFVDRAVEVDKPVAVQPITANDVPAVPGPLGAPPATDEQRRQLLLSKVCEFVAYALLADPALRHSAGLPPQALPDYPECDK